MFLYKHNTNDVLYTFRKLQFLFSLLFCHPPRTKDIQMAEGMASEIRIRMEHI